MAGGGGDAPPLPSSNGGGEFLLSLLQKAPHHHYTHQPRSHHQHQPSPNLDPAVAAVGPTLPWGSPSNGRDHFPHHRPIPAGPTSSSSSSLWPTNSHQPPPPPDFNNFLGFPQNPYHSSSPPQFGTHQFNQFADELREQKLKLAYITRQQESASVASGTSSDIANLANGFDRGLRLNPGMNYNSMEHHLRGGGAGQVRERGKQVQRTMPPPGFGNKPQGVGGNWDSRRGGDERNAGSREMQGSGGFARNWEGTFENERARRIIGGEDGEVRGNVDGRKGLSAQLDRPGPPAGVNLHSVPASEIEESMMSLEGGGGERARKDGDGVEDVGLHEVDDGGHEKNEGKQHHKDSRSDDRGQHQLTQRMRHIKKQTLCRFDIERLNAPFLELFESLIPTEEEKAKQKRVLALLENIICKEWPDARLYIYGSCGNSFGVSKSDIDLCLAIGKEDINKCEILLRLAELLESDKLENVQALTRARVPIVKLMDPVTGISCDICINNVLAVVNTKLLRDYANIDARLRQLAFIVKHWAKSRGVNETYHGTLSSYAYVLMCIHFLQQRRILPCLQGMRPTYSVTVENIECAFFDQVDKLQDFGSHNTETIAELVWAFFHYWAYSHDYANTVVSIRRGRTISKREKDWTRRIGNDRHLICIEDPFETSHDLGRVVDKYSIKVLREEFERAAEILQHDANPCVKLFEPYFRSIQTS